MRRRNTSATALAVVAAVLVAGFTATAMAQQAVVEPQPRVAPQVQQVRPQVTRSYRSYSVSPSTEPAGSSRYSKRHSGHATWRHGDSKARGQYHSGR
jgi:hypothetical protein